MNVLRTRMDERVLEDDYPVYVGYLYVADEKVVRSNIEGTIKRLKQDLNASVITNCDIKARNLWHEVL